MTTAFLPRRAATCAPLAHAAPAAPAASTRHRVAPSFPRRLWWRVLSWWGQAVAQHRARQRARAEWHTLQGLSDSTLRDIGLAERRPPYDVSQSAIDIERCRW